MYEPKMAILEKYADILINFALNSGKGVKPGEVVYAVVPDSAKPMYGALQAAILKAGAHPLMRFIATGFDKQFYSLSDLAQLKFFPKKYLKERVALIDHSVAIIADHDLHELEGTDPKKIVVSAEAQKPYRDWLFTKEYQGKFTWTIGLYGTEALAKEAGLSLRAYWQEIIEACYLDKAEPVVVWREIVSEQERIKDRLKALKIDKIHLEAAGTDLWLTLGENRRFMGGGGRNVPSFEIFTSPDWRGTEGVISFNQPLYRYGQLLENVTLRFHKGKVIGATAKKGERILKEMLKRPNADKVGEFSLTDGRMSRITHFMANTLFDENRGGPQGNTHIAIGMSYKDAYDGNPQDLTKKDWRELGFNDSGEHCDIVSTSPRKVTVTTNSGVTKLIYTQGKFLI